MFSSASTFSHHNSSRRYSTASSSSSTTNIMGDHYRRPSLSAVTPNGSLPALPKASSPAAAFDLYTVNSLNSFSFGNAQSSGSSSSTSSPVSPLDADDDESSAQYDITPRPSVVDSLHRNHRLRTRRSHSSQNSRHRKRSSDAASHHTFGASSSSASVTSLSASEGVEFDDDMYYSDEERIEISSVKYDGSTIDIEDRYFPHAQTPAASFASGFGERRVSLPIAVPDRDREGSILTLRRPSKSLDEDSPLSITTVTNTNEPSSVPESDGDWKSLRARKGKSKESPSMTAPPVALLSSPTSPQPQDFDPDWSAIGRGITSFDQPMFAALSESRRGSSNSIFPWGRRPSTATNASIYSNEDPFFRAVGSLWAPDYRDQRRAWTFGRERADGPGTSSISSASKKGRGSIGDPPKFGITSITSTTHREREKETWRNPVNWKGMPIGSQELWANELVGRFKVDRRAIVKQEDKPDAAGKGPIQRLVIEHFRDGFTKNAMKHDDPSVMVHKHSKTVAFSISRFYKLPRGKSAVGRRTTSVNMILLAPRKVQEAYTSTTTTRKLESHGLLEDDRHKRRERHKSAAQKNKPFDAQSSGGSVTSTSSRPTSSSGSTSQRTHRDSWDYEDPILPPRTPHSEAYGTVDAAQLEQIRQHHQSHGSDDSAGFLARFFRPKRSELPAQRMVVYNPSWVTLEPRNKQEQTQRVVENLNHSFQEVGLLQVNKPRSSKGREKGRRKEDKEPEGWQEIFREIPDEVLYMLLPLWPSDTDPHTSATEEMFPRPQVERQYLLVCYKVSEPPSSSSASSKRMSPTSSSESKEKDDKNIILPAFNITGRLVSHKDIQGSGMRVSEGLTVNGSLTDAYDKMPPISSNTTTVMIGMCRSREAGVEFLPEGLIELGLCMTYNAYPPGTIAEEAEALGQPRPVVELTPIGRAVVEMAWVGGLAVTSFGSPAMSKA